MKHELENGKVEGLPATLFIARKPSFTTLDGFFNIIFELADDIGKLE